MQCKIKKEAGGISEVRWGFFFPLFTLPQEGTSITDIPALCFPQGCCFAVSAWMQDLVLCVPCIAWSVGEAGLCVGGDTELGIAGVDEQTSVFGVSWGQLGLSLLFVLS